MFSSTEVMSRQFTYFLSRVPEEFFYYPILFSLLGAWRLLFHDRRRLLFFFLLITGCVAYAVNYDIHDIDSYFLLAYSGLALIAAYGIYELFEWTTSSRIRNSVFAGLLVLVGIQVWINRQSVDESTNYLVEDYSHAMFASLQPNALILSYQWDYFVAGSYYLQYVKHERPDVVVIDKELLRRSWYLEQIRNNHPDIYERSRGPIQLFLVELNKFEHDLPYDPTVIEARYNAMIDSFFDRNAVSRPLYVTTEIEPHLASGYVRIPEGLAWRLYKDTLYHPYTAPPIVIRPYAQTDKYTTQLYGLIKTMQVQRELYERSHRPR
jgi:hypothetical protein